MSKKEAPLHALAAYLPDNTFEKVADYLLKYKVHLTITPERQSVLGDYRQPDYYKGHRISINGNLNPYEFLLTLLHELAHLIAFITYGNAIASHGKEWQQIYRQVMLEFTGKNIFPPPVEAAVYQSIQNPAATKCGEEHLTRVLRKYDKRSPHHLLIEELKIGELFVTKDNQIFEKGEKIRTRYRCKEIKSGKIYLFSAMYEVQRINNSEERTRL